MRHAHRHQPAGDAAVLGHEFLSAHQERLAQVQVLDDLRVAAFALRGRRDSAVAALYPAKKIYSAVYGPTSGPNTYMYAKKAMYLDMELTNLLVQVEEDQQDVEIPDDEAAVDAFLGAFRDKCVFLREKQLCSLLLRGHGVPKRLMF